MPVVLREMRRRLQQQRGLADPRLAADQHERSGHDAAAEHAIELVDPGRQARRHDGVDVFVQPRPGRRRERVARSRARRRRARARGRRHRALLDERVPRLALGTAAQPLLRLRAAFLAGVRLTLAASWLRTSISMAMCPKSSLDLRSRQARRCRSIRVPTRQSSSYGIVPIDAAISRMPISSPPCSPTITTSSPGRHVHPGHVDHRHVHAHRADDGYAFSAYQHERAAGHAAIEAVGVAGGDDGDRARVDRRPSAARSRCLRRDACPSRARYGCAVTGQVAAGAVAASGGGTMP